MEGLDTKAYDDILGLTNIDYGTVAAVAICYRDESDKNAWKKRQISEKIDYSDNLIKK